MAFPDSFLQELADRNPIEDVVSGYVRLTKRSGANLFGLCPFHSEKTPSFSVAPDKQIYHCFGCGKGGSVINFIMEIENLSFPDAVQFLARRAGMEVPEDKPDPNSQRRARMLSLNRDAARFFYDCLRTAPGREKALAYIEKRGISPAMVKNFGLGFAPDSWDSLVNAMRQKGYTANEMADAGLVRHSRKGTGGVYDTFRDRLMFPVIDVRGNVIGFSGRILGDGEPKYMNSPETLVFNKSRNLFALNLAKKSKSGYIILSEGNIDVVALHQAGFDSAVASLGTALTADQARLMSRYVKEVVIAYDSDAAGQKAARRAIDILDKLDMQVRVLQLSGAKDPDEFIKTKGADAFRNLLERSENHIEYRLSAVRNKYDLSVDEQRVSFLKEATVLLSELSGAVEREVYATRVAELAGVSREVVEQEALRLKKRRAGQDKRKYERETLRPARSAQPAEKSIHYENAASAMAEQGVLRLLYLEPELFRGQIPLTAADFSSPLLGRFFEKLLERAQNNAPVSMAALSGEFTSEELSHLTALLDKPERLSNSQTALRDYINKIRSERQKATAEDFAAAAARIRQQKQGHGG